MSAGLSQIQLAVHLSGGDQHDEVSMPFLQADFVDPKDLQPLDLTSSTVIKGPQDEGGSHASS
jgi:hypothetical protein